MYRKAPPRKSLINIDPKKVTHLLTPHFCSELPTHAAYVRGGNWDKNKTDHSLMLVAAYDDNIHKKQLISMENYGLYKAMNAHFEKGVPWEDTEFYQWISKKDITTRTPTIYERFGSDEKIQNRFSEIDQLYENIRRSGFKSKEPPILVNISRDGNFILDDGRHRLIIAQLLGLDSIPVAVFVRHTGWQQIREAVAKGQNPTERADCSLDCGQHPDLQTI